ncbi:hypothetical protein [Arthrobacter sp. MYb213]|uniref:hypothetical protein n=1 Tax=Arthrobacter sp. MYb213 TaxID=1848595 RepID=UPI000CFDDD2F|nr:hypothetical protein [Arthrobacter sp. MYb213]PRB69412.1 hypothetical protein CQ011_11600 [Arthrobacter sp. MYb213]
MDLVELLLSGRRGRRLLWQFTLDSEDQTLSSVEEHPLVSAMFHASYQVEVTRGDSVVMFGPGAEVGRTVRVSVEELGRLISITKLLPVTEGLLQKALEDSVGHARYWQEPDGEDTLLVAPALRNALHRVAEHIVASGFTQQWLAPVDLRTQFHVEFDQPDPAGSVTSIEPNVFDELRRWKENLILTEARARAEKPTPVTAMISGEWWSKPSWDLRATTGVFTNHQPIGVSCVEDAFNWEQAVARKASVLPSVKVLEILTANDWVQLCRSYGVEVTAHKRHDWYRTTGRDGAWMMPDWLAVAQDYDGVHLSIAGYLALAGECLEVDEKFATVIAGWDPDKTYWFTDELRFYAEPDIWNLLDANNEDRRWVRS